MSAKERARETGGGEPRIVAPSADSLSWCTQEASRTTNDLGDGRLVTLALRSDTSEHLSTEAQAYVDSLNLSESRSRLATLEHWHTRTQLAIDVLAHEDNCRRVAGELVCSHRIADDDIVPYRTEHLPLVRLVDPVARWLGARIGDVLVEERDEPSRGLTRYYRHVVGRVGES